MVFQKIEIVEEYHCFFMVRLVVHVSYSGFVTDIGNKISDAGEKAWNAVEETYNNAKREVEEFASDVKQGVVDLMTYN